MYIYKLVLTDSNKAITYSSAGYTVPIHSILLTDLCIHCVFQQINSGGRGALFNLHKGAILG